MNEPGARPSDRRRPDRAALWIAAGLLALAGLLAWDASRLGSGGAYARIGPQTIPLIVAICLCGLAAWTVVAAYRGDFPARERQERVPVLWIVSGLLVQMALIRFVGFSLATGLLFAMTARAFGRVNLPSAFLSGTLISLAVWFVFARLLQLTLPAGPLEQMLAAGVDQLLSLFQPASPA